MDRRDSEYATAKGSLDDSEESRKTDKGETGTQTEEKKPAAAPSSPGKKKAASAKRTRAKKPKDMPRRPLSAYNLFFRDQRALLLQEKAIQMGQSSTSGVRMGFEALAKIIGPRWKAISKDQKAHYAAKAEEEAARYKRQLEEYHASGTFTPVEAESTLTSSATASSATVNPGLPGSSIPYAATHALPTLRHEQQPPVELQGSDNWAVAPDLSMPHPPFAPFPPTNQMVHSLSNPSLQTSVEGPSVNPKLPGSSHSFDSSQLGSLMFAQQASSQAALDPSLGANLMLQSNSQVGAETQGNILNQPLHLHNQPNQPPIVNPSLLDAVSPQQSFLLEQQQQPLLQQQQQPLLQQQQHPTLLLQQQQQQATYSSSVEGKQEGWDPSFFEPRPFRPGEDAEVRIQEQQRRTLSATEDVSSSSALGSHITPQSVPAPSRRDGSVSADDLFEGNVEQTSSQKKPPEDDSGCDLS